MNPAFGRAMQVGIHADKGSALPNPPPARRHLSA